MDPQPPERDVRSMLRKPVEPLSEMLHRGGSDLDIEADQLQAFIPAAGIFVFFPAGSIS
jgi:hypothetical protein